MKIRNKTIGILLFTGLLFISTFLTWGSFSLNNVFRSSMPKEVEVKLPFGDDDKSINVSNPLSDFSFGKNIRQDATGWKTNIKVLNMKIDTWILVILGVVAGVFILFVDTGAINMGMLFPRVFLLLTTAGVGLFVYIMIKNDGLAIGSVLALISSIALFIMSFGRRETTA